MFKYLKREKYIIISMYLDPIDLLGWDLYYTINWLDEKKHRHLLGNDLYDIIFN